MVRSQGGQPKNSCPLTITWWSAALVTLKSQFEPDSGHQIYVISSRGTQVNPQLSEHLFAIGGRVRILGGMPNYKSAGLQLDGYQLLIESPRLNARRKAFADFILESPNGEGLAR